MKKTHLTECFIEKSTHAIPITVLHERDYPEWLATQTDVIQQWVKNNLFEPTRGTILFIPSDDGKIAQVLIGLLHDQDTAALARAAVLLPAGEYQLADMPFYDHHACMKSPLFYLAWGLEQYRFSMYKPNLAEAPIKSLLVPASQNLQFMKKTMAAVCQVRDLVNTPAQDLNPDTLEKFVQALAEKHHASFQAIVGDDLLTQNFPAIHTVGRASVFKPRLLEFNWGNPSHPQVTLVGKGVCFDTGGLDLKTASGMLLMRKDMSGAAQVLGLATLIMETHLPIRLRVLIPAVENAIAGNAYHPGDVIKTRKGLSVNIDNTDAEGRLILSDTLTYAMESPPELLIDVASLTGASMATFGYEIASFFTNDDACALELAKSSQRVSEPLWRMPLHAPYKELISPETTDLTNACLIGYAGSITAALFLQEFAAVADHPNMTWIHFDTSAWNDRPKPGKPVGGEATVVRSLYDYLTARFSV